MNKIYIIIFKFHGDNFWKCCIFHILHADSLIVNTLRAEEIKVMYCVFSCYVEADCNYCEGICHTLAFGRVQLSAGMFLHAESGIVKIPILFKIGRRLFDLVACMLSLSWKKLTCWQHVDRSVYYVRIKSRKSLQVRILQNHILRYNDTNTKKALQTAYN